MDTNQLRDRIESLSRENEMLKLIINKNVKWYTLEETVNILRDRGFTITEHVLLAMLIYFKIYDARNAPKEKYVQLGYFKSDTFSVHLSESGLQFVEQLMSVTGEELLDTLHLSKDGPPIFFGS